MLRILHIPSQQLLQRSTGNSSFDSTVQNSNAWYSRFVGRRYACSYDHFDFQEDEAGCPLPCGACIPYPYFASIEPTDLPTSSPTVK